MAFVDQTIVSIAIPFIDRGLSLSAVARATELGRLTDAALASGQASSGVMELGDTK